MINGLADLEGANCGELLGFFPFQQMWTLTTLYCYVWTKQPPNDAKVQFRLPSIAKKLLYLTPFLIQNRLQSGSVGPVPKAFCLNISSPLATPGYARIFGYCK